MRTQLVAMTLPTVPGITTAEDFIGYVARVSNPANQMNTETAPRLLSYLIKNHHWSPFEMVSLTVEIETTRDIARQILRHRSFSFQEFCLSGDSDITVMSESGAANNHYKLKQLYDRFSKGLTYPARIRVFDEDTKTFTKAPIKGVFQTGEKDLFEIELFNGKKLKSTKEHKFLTENGFQSLENLCDLRISNDMAVWNNSQDFIGCNGIPVWRDKTWMEVAKKESLSTYGEQYVADKAGCKKATIHKWLSFHGLQYTKKETAMWYKSWNTGKRYTTGKKRSDETRAKMRTSAKRGSESNLWKGGVERSERKKIADYIGQFRSRLLEKFDYTCDECQVKGGSLHLHHNKPVFSHPELAYDVDNIRVVCKDCHWKIHNLNGDAKIWRTLHRGNTLTTKWSKIKTIRYVGKEMTYDIEVDHKSHNYVANGIVVHNSQRYADPTNDLGFVRREARLQDAKNRQNSIDIDLDSDTKHLETSDNWDEIQREMIEQSLWAYRWAIDHGIAKEQARSVLPEGLTVSRIYMSGTLRSWIHYVQLRSANGTQKEHMEIAQDIRDSIIKVQFPSLREALEG